jgi:multiple sugar transport system permease protein
VTTDTPELTAPPAAAGAGSHRAVRRPRSSHVVSKLTVNLVLLLIAACFVVPLLWVVLAAFNESATLSVTWPDPWSIGNFAAVLDEDTTYRPMLNGFILCGTATLVTIAASVLAAYPLSRYQSRYKRPFLLTILFTTGLPITAIMVPVYGMFVQVDLIDTYLGTILAIWLTKNFMDAVPIELEEAAWTDGAAPMQALRRIVLPLMWPGMSVVAIYTFIHLWGNFFVPFILLQSNDNLPASVSIFSFFSQYGQVVYGQLAAYSVIYSLPALLLYLVLSRRLGGAFAFGGAVKG